MKLNALIAVAAATVVAAQQPVFNQTSGRFDCPIANATYCAGDSLTTNIIIRCIGLVGYPGNCNDNLDGDFPFGLNYSPCWASPSQPGVAACSKNCIVYGGSGNYPGDFTLPNCVPYATSTSSSAPTSMTSTTSSSSAASSATSSSMSYSEYSSSVVIPTSGPCPTTTILVTASLSSSISVPSMATFTSPPPTSSLVSRSSVIGTPTTFSTPSNSTTTITASVFTTVCPSATTFTYGTQTYTVTTSTTLTITNCPCTPTTPMSSTSMTYVSSPQSLTTSPAPYSTACLTSGGGNSSIMTLTMAPSGSATGTPVAPTTSPRPSFVPSAANANAAGVLVAAMGLIVAYLL